MNATFTMSHGQVIQPLILALTEQSDAEPQYPHAQADALAASETYTTPQRFHEIYQRYHDVILNYLYRRTRLRDLAEDLTAHTFLQALRHLQSRETHNLQVRPWLYRIATTQHLQHLRSQRRWHNRIPLIGNIISIAQPAIEEEIPVQQMLLHLPEKDRTSLILRYYENLSYREIASTLQVPEATARSHVRRALEKLRKEFGPQS